MRDISKIRLVIWDLDDTFWRGTLSEGEVIPIYENIELVKKLSLRGIINTICSKNDFSPAMDKLKDLGVSDYFVFPSIDWTPKGPRVANLIKEIGLRPVNCLFIDDNPVNLNEAKFYSDELLVEAPTIISDLILYTECCDVSDPSLSRLKQYQVLYQKQIAKSEAVDNMSFLYSSNTIVEIHTDCTNVSDRLFEMIHRTNQLNFTKYRCSREEFDSLLNDETVSSGYVTVKDKFGDYGIVGFYAIKDNKCVHFLFSCRTIGQGVEQWVYSTLNYPMLETVDPVVNHVLPDTPAPKWINQNQTSIKHRNDTLYDGKIVFKGPCDLEIVSSYLKVLNVSKEFTYVGANRSSVEHHNHSVNYLSFPFLSEDERCRLLSDAVFNDKNMFRTKMYDNDTVVLVISTLIEGNLGVYRRKEDGFKIAYGEWTYPLTDENNWSRYINMSDGLFTNDSLTKFRESYEFIGRQTPADFIVNLKQILDKVSSDTVVCLMLGSEMPYEKNKQLAYVSRDEYHKELNKLLRDYAETTSRIRLVDFNKYIHSQEDFTDNINHFQRRVYFEAAQELNYIISEVTGTDVSMHNALVRCFSNIKGMLYRKLAELKFLRKIVRYIKSRL